MAAVCGAVGLAHIATDGEACRSAPRGAFSGCLHRVSAWAAGGRPILGQPAVADGWHEIAATPGLLEVLELKGAPVTLGAAGCQEGIAERIREGGGDCLPAVGGDRPALRDAVRAVLDRACETDFAGAGHDGHESSEDRHGRHGERYVTAICDPRGLPPEWPDVAAVALVGREREVKGERADTTHYDVTSLRGAAAEPGRLIRRHWAAENESHWRLDVASREGASGAAAGHAGTNLGLVRRVAASLAKQHPDEGGIKGERLEAALDEGDSLPVLQGFMEG